MKPANIQLTSQKHQQQQPTLPCTTSLSNSILPLSLTQPHHHHTSLLRSSLRYLSLVLIRELAILEDLFIQSPIYRLIRYLTPSVLLPKSSTYPFLFTLTLGVIQLKKTWDRQPNLLVNLFISLGPIIHTLRALHASDIQHHHPNHYSSSPDSHPLKRWSIYWLIYCALINLESLNVRVQDQSQPTLLRSRPIIYPSIPQQNPPHHQSSFHLLTAKILHLFKSFSSRYPRNSAFFNLPIPKLSIIPTSSSKPFPNQGSKAPRIPIESFDIHTSITSTSLGRNIRRIPLPQYLFGKDERVYRLLKVIFLRWCSREEGRVMETIWGSFLSPMASMMDGSRWTPQGQARRGRRTKVVKVMVEEGEDGIGGSNPNELRDQDLTWRSKLEGLYNQPVESSKEQPVRKIRSDPGGRSHPSSTQVDPIQIPLDSSSSPSIGVSSRRSTNPSSTALDIHQLPLSHSSIDPLKLSDTHPLVDLKTPENAWDSLSYIG